MYWAWRSGSEEISVRRNKTSPWGRLQHSSAHIVFPTVLSGEIEFLIWVCLECYSYIRKECWKNTFFQWTWGTLTMNSIFLTSPSSSRLILQIHFQIKFKTKRLVTNEPNTARLEKFINDYRMTTNTRLDISVARSVSPDLLLTSGRERGGGKNGYCDTTLTVRATNQKQSVQL